METENQDPIVPTAVPPRRHKIPLWAVIAIIIIAAGGIGYLAWSSLPSICCPKSQDLKPASQEEKKLEDYGLILPEPPQGFELRTTPGEEGFWAGSFIQFPTEEGKVLAVYLLEDPKNIYPGTDLDEAYLAVQILDESKDVCERGGNGTEVIDGQKFYLRNNGNAAAGHQQNSLVYSTFRNNMCLAMYLNVETSGYGAVEGLERVNSDPLFEQLHQILSTFRFFESRVDTTNWKTYRNDANGFEFKLPPKWSEARIDQSRNEFDGVDYSINLVLGDSGYHIVCVISLYPDSKWPEVEAQPVNRPIYLAKKAEKVFASSCGHDDGGYKGFEVYNAAIEEGNFDAINKGEIMGPFQEFNKLILPTFTFTEAKAGSVSESTACSVSFNKAADDIESGNIESALKFFGSSPQDREVLESLSGSKKQYFVAGLRNAKLKTQQSTAYIYEVTAVPGVPAQEMMLSLAPDGTCKVVSW